MALVDVIKYEGDNQTFVWKHPQEDFNTGSQLIVHESQEAVFFLNGQALDLFGPGRHELTTQNLPLVNKLFKLPTGGTTPFHAEVYFVNKAEQMAVGWGTSSRVQYMDPSYGFPLSLGASGEMSLRIEDSRRLLVKLVGTEALLNQASLVRYFSSFVQTGVKAYLGQEMLDPGISIFSVDAQMSRFSDELLDCLKVDLEPYGVALESFRVTNLAKPDGDPDYERLKDLHFRQYADVRDAQIRQQVGVIDQQTLAQQTVIEARAMAEKRSLEGYTYQQERGFDVASQLATNRAVGEFTNIGVGLGMMTGVGGQLGGLVGTMASGAFDSLGAPAQPTTAEMGVLAAMGAAAASGSSPTPAATETPSEATSQARFCPECGRAFNDGERFCPACGTKRSV